MNPEDSARVSAYAARWLEERNAHCFLCQQCGVLVDKRILSMVLFHQHAGPVPDVPVGIGRRVDDEQGEDC